MESGYKNHHILKINRLIKLKKNKLKCELCGAKAYQVHHIDESKDNHSLDNLMVLCQECHSGIHSGRKNKISKYILLYGMTLSEMARRYGGTTAFYSKIHKEGKLLDFIENPTPQKLLELKYSYKIPPELQEIKPDPELFRNVKKNRLNSRYLKFHLSEEN